METTAAPAPRRTPGRPKAQYGTVTRQTLDLLYIHGGWMTAYAISHELQVPDSNLRQILARLTTAGWITSRQLEQVSHHQAGRVEYRWVADPPTLAPEVSEHWRLLAGSDDTGRGILTCRLCGGILRDHGPAGTRCTA